MRPGPACQLDTACANRTHLPWQQARRRELTGKKPLQVARSDQPTGARSAGSIKADVTKLPRCNAAASTKMDARTEIKGGFRVLAKAWTEIVRGVADRSKNLHLVCHQPTQADFAAFKIACVVLVGISAVLCKHTDIIEDFRLYGRVV